MLLKLYFRGWGGVQVEEYFEILQKVAHKNDFGNLVMSLTHFGTTLYLLKETYGCNGRSQNLKGISKTMWGKLELILAYANCSSLISHAPNP